LCGHQGFGIWCGGIYVRSPFGGKGFFRLG